MTVWIHSPFDNLPQEGFRKQRYWLMAEAFVQAGHEVVYWTGDFNHGTKAKRKLSVPVATEDRLELKMIPVRPYAENVSLRRLFSHIDYARRLARTIGETQLKNPQLIISATPMLGAAKVLMVFARRVGAKVVIDVQDAWPETFVRLLPRSLAWVGRIILAPMFRLARRIYADANRVLGVSERYRTIVRRDDYLVFYHGVSTASPQPRVKRDCKKLVYVGNLGAGYDLLTVLEAVVENSSLSLDIAGEGPQLSTLKAFVAERKLGDRVVFHGYLDRVGLEKLLATMEVGIIPMRDDSWVGLPYKLGDYLAAGLSVVSSLHGECGDLLMRTNFGVTYTQGSVRSLLSALEKINPSVPVILPEELRADRIYPAYVTECVGRFFN